MVHVQLQWSVLYRGKDERDAWTGCISSGAVLCRTGHNGDILKQE